MSILFDMLTLKSNVYLPFVISPEFPHAELIASDIEWCYTFCGQIGTLITIGSMQHDTYLL
jgi:hypothetical protein